MTKQSGPIGHPKQRRPVFYLDRNLCAHGLPERLREAGYLVIAYTEEYGRVHNQSISDPQLIRSCGKRGHILISADKRMEYQYAPEIYESKVGIVLLVNQDGGAEGWIQRLLAAQSAILDQIASRRKPFLIRVSQDGTLTKVKLYRKDGQKSIQLY